VIYIAGCRSTVEWLVKEPLRGRLPLRHSRRARGPVGEIFEPVAFDKLRLLPKALCYNGRNRRRWGGDNKVRCDAG